MLAFSLSALLALAGMAAAILGILAEELKAVGVGAFLIFGAGIFATLYLGARRKLIRA